MKKFSLFMMLLIVSFNSVSPVSAVTSDKNRAVTDNISISGKNLVDHPTVAFGESNLVASDPDEKREDFEGGLDAELSQSPTSVDIPTPIEITNDEQYKQQAKAQFTYVGISNYKQLVDAWGNTSITYIDILSDITADSTAMPSRGSASVIVQGNNNTLDLKSNTFRLGYITTSTTITLTNLKVQEGFAAVDGNAYSLINPLSATQLTANVNNVTLSPSLSNGQQAVHLIYGPGSKLVFSGVNTFNIVNEISRSVGTIEFANNAKVTLQRTSKDNTYSEFYFYGRAPEGSVGAGNAFRMGNGSSNRAFTYENKPANYPAIWYDVDNVEVGDDVEWEQSGFQRFLDGSYYPLASAKYKFGQNFKLISPITTQPGFIKLRGTQEVEFNAGTIMDISQNITGEIFNLANTSKLTFVSPKSLSIGVFDNKGNVAAGSIAKGTGSFSMNNSFVNSWSGLASSATNAPTSQGSFISFSQINGVTTVTGGSADNSIITQTTREIKTQALPVGKIKINYINQNGTQVGSTEVPLSNETNFIGQVINLRRTDLAIDDMPTGYKWAIDEQVYQSAPVGDKGQPGGDTTSTVDNGDEFGQLDLGIVPMVVDDYTYDVYVYGEDNPNITYTYIDVDTGLPIATTSSSVGIEKARSINLPSNIGNVIDWTKVLYTKTNVPTGYEYVEKGSSILPPGIEQPTGIEVIDTSTEENVEIFVKDPTVKTGAIQVKYVDIDSGDEISPSDQLKGEIGDSFTISSKDIEGYEVVEKPDSESGTYTDTLQTFTYKYKKIASSGKVSIKYVDIDSGDEISPSDQLEGEIGDSFTISSKDIEGYEVVEKPDSESGTYTDTLQTFTYKYRKAVEGPGYLITVPSKVEFDPKNPKESINTDVEMLDEKDPNNKYDGSGTAEVTVQSLNGFKLKGDKEDLSYQLNYAEGGTIKEGTEAKEIGKFSKDMTNNKGRAYLVDNTLFKGLYSDVLTYTIIDTTKEIKKSK